MFFYDANNQQIGIKYCVFGSTANITITNNTATVVDGCHLRDGTAVAA